MSVRLMITLLIFGVAQGLLFGLSVVVILVSSLQTHAAILIPLAVVLSTIAAAPLAWKFAPIMRSRHVREAAAARRWRTAASLS